MLRIRDSFILAGTKLKTRRIRLWMSLIFISLLCSMISIFFISLEQSSKSLDDFSNEGLNGRFLAKISGKNGEIMSAYDVPDELISKAEQMYRQKISEDKQKAKTEDFEYVEDDSQNSVQSINSEKNVEFSDGNCKSSND